MINLEDRLAAAVGVKRVSTPIVEAGRGTRWSVERVASSFLGFGKAALCSKISALENGCGFSAEDSWAGLDVIAVAAVAGPFGRQDPIAFWQGIEAPDIVTVPEEELQVLGRQLNVLEEVHKVADSAGLIGVSECG
jgi:hypothetical protein